MSIENLRASGKQSVTVVVTTYNKPQMLELVLESLTRQSCIPDQVIVADDGSTNCTALVVKKYMNALPIEHVWQADRTFRAARCRNLAATRITAEYVLFIDGDCVLPPRFVESHIRLRRSGTLVAGGRLLLTRKETDEILKSGITKLRKASLKWLKMARLYLGPLRDLNSKNWKIVRTCNMSLNLHNLIEAGGFDESFEGWGREDSDFVVRLISSGVTIRSGRYSACVVHLWHPEESKQNLTINDERFNNTMLEGKRVSQKSLLLNL